MKISIPGQSYHIIKKATEHGRGISAYADEVVEDVVDDAREEEVQVINGGAPTVENFR